MSTGTRAVYVLDAVRTPFGRYGGALAGVRPDDLAAHVLRALMERSGLASLCIGVGQGLAVILER